jgi:hypothetical protein
MDDQLCPDDVDFSVFCSAVREWFLRTPRSSPEHPALAAAADLLERRSLVGGTWLACEVAHLAATADDMHSVLGAGVLLQLWRARVAGRT